MRAAAVLRVIWRVWVCIIILKGHSLADKTRELRDSLKPRYALDLGPIIGEANKDLRLFRATS